MDKDSKKNTSITLSKTIMDKANELVDQGLFENRSHAIRKTLSDVWGLNPKPESINAPTHTHSPE